MPKALPRAPAGPPQPASGFAVLPGSSDGGEARIAPAHGGLDPLVQRRSRGGTVRAGAAEVEREHAVFRRVDGDDAPVRGDVARELAVDDVVSLIGGDMARMKEAYRVLQVVDTYCRMAIAEPTPEQRDAVARVVAAHR